MLRSISWLHECKGQSADAIRAAREALEIVRGLEDPKSEVEMLILLAQAQTSALVRDKASAASQAPGEKRSRPKATQEEYFALLELGYDPVTITRRFFGAGGPSARVKPVSEDQAMETAREAVVLSQAEIADDEDYHGYAVYIVAQIHHICKRYDETLMDARQALEVFQRTENAYGEACVTLLIAQADHEQGAQASAEAGAERARDMFRENGNEEGLRRAEEILSEIKMAGQPLMTALPMLLAGGGAAASSAGLVVEKQGMAPDLAMKMIREVAEELIEADGELDMDSPLMDVGLDSLAAVQFRQNLQEKSGINLPASLIFDYPTARSMTDFIVEATS